MRALAAVLEGLLEYQDQSSFGLCDARKLEKSEAEIDWMKAQSWFATKFTRCHLRRAPILRS
jgi:hypothetical protein